MSDRSAAVLKVGGGAAVKEQSVAGRTEPDMREKGKHVSRSSGFVDRRVIVHRSADRGAVRFYTFCLLCARYAEALVAVKPSATALFLSDVICERSCVWFYRRAPDIPQSGFAAASDGIFSNILTVSLLKRPSFSAALRCSSVLLSSHSQINRQKEKLQGAMQVQ